MDECYGDLLQAVVSMATEVHLAKDSQQTAHPRNQIALQ
jgi:hypothetical protein